jgi:hypothetical protein
MLNTEHTHSAIDETLEILHTGNEGQLLNTHLQFKQKKTANEQ